MLLVERTSFWAKNDLLRMALKQAWRVISIVLLFGFTLAPIIRIIFILSTYGGNNPSVDDLMIAPLIDKILSGHYHWTNFFHDTFLNGHAQVFPVLTHLLFAFFTSWNVKAMLYFGLFLAALKLLFAFDALTCLCKHSLRWYLLPLFSFLFFSPSQMTVFEFEFPSIQLGINHLAFIFGLWGLVKFQGRWLGIGLMTLGGIVASFSWASGVFVWPVYLAALYLLKFRRFEHYMVWFFAALLSAMPYFYFLFLNPVSDLYSVVELRSFNKLPFVSAFNLPFIIPAFGISFAQDYSMEAAYWRGLVGIGLLIIAIAILWTRRHKPEFIYSVPALMILMFSLLNIWEISLFRWHLAPWYASPFMLFWVGLVGLAYSLSYDRKTFMESLGGNGTIFNFLTHLWYEAVLALIVFFYLTSNLTFEDKSYYLQTRSPVSASCLRHYSTAPTYCERSLFLWDPGQYQLLSMLGKPIERQQLAVFSQRQHWTLQGDFILDSVKVIETPNIPHVSWSADLTAEPVPFSDYRDLNLFLHTPNAVEWTVSLPKNLDKAEFFSAIAISKSAPHDPQSDGVHFKVSVQIEGKAPEVLFEQQVSAEQREWIPFVIPLTKFSGQTITLRLASEMNGNFIHDWAMYRHPSIDLSLNSRKDQSVGEIEPKPSNTDLNPFLVKPKEGDFIFNVKDPLLWTKNSLAEDESEGLDVLPLWMVDHLLKIEYKEPLDLCLADYSHFSFKIGVPADIYPRATRIFLKIAGENRLFKEIWVPLLKSGDPHQYTYDLKLLELGRSARLTGLAIKPLYRLKPSRIGDIQLSDLRLIRSSEKSQCD